MDESWKQKRNGCSWVRDGCCCTHDVAQPTNDKEEKRKKKLGEIEQEEEATQLSFSVWLTFHTHYVGHFIQQNKKKGKIEKSNQITKQYPWSRHFGHLRTADEISIHKQRGFFFSNFLFEMGGPPKTNPTRFFFLSHPPTHTHTKFRLLPFVPKLKPVTFDGLYREWNALKVGVTVTRHSTEKYYFFFFFFFLVFVFVFFFDDVMKEMWNKFLPVESSILVEIDTESEIGSAGSSMRQSAGDVDVERQCRRQ